MFKYLPWGGGGGGAQFAQGTRRRRRRSAKRTPLPLPPLLAHGDVKSFITSMGRKKEKGEEEGGGKSGCNILWSAFSCCSVGGGEGLFLVIKKGKGRLYLSLFLRFCVCDVER